MTAIKAFVGHSFTEDDRDVVQAFTNYLNQVSGILPGFSWVHAEGAEPKALDDKVIPLMEGCNTFIGICTKKEMIIAESNLEDPWWSKEKVVAKRSHFGWKTSDWIIQEIGLAIGNGLDLILLLEDDVAPPGGLQGNVEYISFDRNSPSRCFGKIVEMLSALSPSSSTSIDLVSGSDVKAATGKEQIDRKPKEDKEVVSDRSNWKRRDFEFQYFKNTVDGDTNGQREIDESFRKSNCAESDIETACWEAHAQWVKIEWGTNGDLSALKSLAERFPKSSEIISYLAKGFETFKEFEQAAAYFNEAADKISTDADRNESDVANHLRRSAVCYAKAGSIEAMEKVNTRLRTMAKSSSEVEPVLLDTLMQIAEINKEVGIKAAVQERLLELNPGNNGLRFDLAYLHSGTEMDDLALFHYQKIPGPERSATTWNNIGVAYDRNSMAASAVTAYRKSETARGTLAMSNLARKFIKAGFLTEAKEICTKALGEESYHKDIGSTLSSLENIPETESKACDSLLEKAKPKSDFYKMLGKAASQFRPASIPLDWEGKDCPLKVEISGDKFSATGEYAKYGGLLRIAEMGRRTRHDKEPTHIIEYTGTVRGRAVEGYVSRRTKTTPRKSLLSIEPNQNKFLMVIGEDGNELLIMESPKSKQADFYSLTVQDT